MELVLAVDSVIMMFRHDVHCVLSVVILYEPFKITIQFPTEIGRKYQIYHSKDLMRWEAVTGILPGSGVVNEFNDEGAEVMGFWKVITVP